MSRSFAFNPALRSARRVPVENLLTGPQRRARATLLSGPLYRALYGWEARGVKFQVATGKALLDMKVARFDPGKGRFGALVLMEGVE